VRESIGPTRKASSGVRTMAPGTVPYIGSKISLVSNSEIRYEGILYTINTQESTIALQSVKTFGTEGRKVPEIPPSSEIYDFIIFRGQDIKDLTVLESAQNASPMNHDPAIMSMNQRPPGGKDNGKGWGKGGASKGASAWDKGASAWDRGGGWGQPSKGKGDKGMSAWSRDGWGKGGGKWDDGYRGGYGDSYHKGSGKGKDHQAYGGGKKGGKDDGKGKGKSKSGDSWKGKGGKDSKGDSKGRSRGEKGSTVNGAPVGELIPEENSAAKKEVAEDFDVAAANTKFDKVTAAADDEGKKPLSGYSKTSSFFDNISCEATDRLSEGQRQKVDRDKAREYDKETFGDTRRPARPAGMRRGKGKGGGKGGYNQGYHS